MSIWDKIAPDAKLGPPSFRHGTPKTHCKHGHELTKENTYTTQMDEWRIKRECKTCSRRRYQEWAARRRASPATKPDALARTVARTHIDLLA